MQPPGSSTAARRAARISSVRPRVCAAFLSALTLCLAPTAWTQTAAFTADFPVSIAVPYSTSQITYSNLPVTNVTSATSSYVTTADYGFVVASVGAPGGTNLLLNFTPGVPPNGTTNAEVVQIAITNSSGSNGTNRHLTVLVAGPPVMPPQFIDGFTAATNRITNIFTTNLVTFKVPTTNADFLTVVSNQATTNLHLTVGNPTFTNAAHPAGFAPTNTNDFSDQSAFGVLNYRPGTNAATNTFQLIASNSVSLQAITSTVSVVSVPLKPLQVRVFNNTANHADSIQFYVSGTGALDPENFRAFYTNSGGTNSLANGYSTNLSALPVGTVDAGTYRQFYVGFVQSGSIYFGLTATPYTNATKAQPAFTGSPTNQWATNTFGDIELAYFGSGGDTADTTAINQLGIPMVLKLCTATSTNEIRGFTNEANNAALPAILKTLQGAPWFGPATNTDIIRLLGPSSAQGAGSIAYVNGASLNNSNYHAFLNGWPAGFSAPTMAPYINAVANEQTNPASFWNGKKTIISKSIGDPQLPGDVNSSQWHFYGELIFTNNTNAIPPGGSAALFTMVPCLTNIKVTNIITYTNNSVVTNTYTNADLFVRYTPDGGSVTNSWFSSYIYTAPPSFKSGSNTGYVTLLPQGQWTNWAPSSSDKWTANVLDAFLNDVAFGFAGGFVHSRTNGWTNGWQTNAAGAITNNSNVGAPDVPIGTMVSSNWWNQTNLYSQLQTVGSGRYSSWGDAIFECAPTIYSHPISDRMQYVDFQPGLPLGAANLDAEYWLEIHLYDPGISTPDAAPPAITNTVVYLSNSLAASFTLNPQNTNGGGFRLTELPDGFSYDPASRLMTVNATNADIPGITAGGKWVAVGLQPYSSSNVSIGQVSVWVPQRPTNLPTTNDISQVGVLTNDTSAPGSLMFRTNVPGGSATPFLIGTAYNSLPAGAAGSSMNAPYAEWTIVTNAQNPGLPVGMTTILSGNTSLFPAAVTDPPNAVSVQVVFEGTPIAPPPGAVFAAGTNRYSFILQASNNIGVTNYTVNYSLLNPNAGPPVTNAPLAVLPTYSVGQNPNYQLPIANNFGMTAGATGLSGTGLSLSNSTNNGLVTVTVVGSAFNTSSTTVTNSVVFYFTNSIGSTNYPWSFAVLGNPNPLLSYSNWLGNYPSLTGTNTNGTADPDGDGFDNAEEYAFGGDPTVGTPAMLTLVSSNASFIGLTNAAPLYIVQNTTNLAAGPWVDYPANITNTTPPFPIPLPASYQGMGFTVPLAPGTNNFYRVIFSNQ